MNEYRQPIVTYILIGVTIVMYGFWMIDSDTFQQLFFLSRDNFFPWQFVTYAFYSPRNILFFFFRVLILFMFGTGLERVWGSPLFAIYMLISILARGILAFIVGYVPLFGSWPLYLGLLVAFGFNYPHHQIRLFFIIPVRVKILAIFFLVLALLQVISSLFMLVEFAGQRTIQLNLPAFLVALAGYINILIFAPKIFDLHHLRRMMHHTENRLRTIKEETRMATVKMDNRKLSAMLEKLETGEPLDETEREFALQEGCSPEQLCHQGDFVKDDDYCLTCDKYEECVRRVIKESLD
jgi:hypothetical protein